MFLIRTHDGATNICTASIAQAFEDFRILQQANLKPSIVDFGGRPVDVVALLCKLRTQRLTERRAA